MEAQDGLDKAAERGNPSFVWREGQERRFEMVQAWADLENKPVLDVGCGMGMYTAAFGRHTSHAVGIEVEFDRAQEAQRLTELRVAEQQTVHAQERQATAEAHAATLRRRSHVLRAVLALAAVIAVIAGIAFVRANTANKEALLVSAGTGYRTLTESADDVDHGGCELARPGHVAVDG